MYFFLVFIDIPNNTRSGIATQKLYIQSEYPTLSYDEIYETVDKKQTSTPPDEAFRWAFAKISLDRTESASRLNIPVGANAAMVSTQVSLKTGILPGVILAKRLMAGEKPLRSGDRSLLWNEK